MSPKKKPPNVYFFGAFFHSWAFRPNSELTAIFNFHLTRMKESALIPKIMHEWLTGGAPVDLGHRIFVEDASPLVRLFSTKKSIPNICENMYLLNQMYLIFVLSSLHTHTHLLSCSIEYSINTSLN